MGGDRFRFYAEYLLDGVDLSLGRWVLVTDGGLDVPVAIRCGRARDGRPIVTGLVIGDAEPVEITSRSLHRIRIGEMLAQLFEGFDPANPPSWDAPISETVEWALVDDLAKVAVPSAAPGRGPSDDDLREFARVYLRELARNPRRAVSATAEALHISRATANRRRNECRERGYLPSEERK